MFGMFDQLKIWRNAHLLHVCDIYIYTKYTYIYIYIWYPPPKIDHFLCFISGDTSQNPQGLRLLAFQLHLASAFWLHRMNMLKEPEEIKKIKTIRVLGENAQVRISESE